MSKQDMIYIVEVNSSENDYDNLQTNHVQIDKQDVEFYWEVLDTIKEGEQGHFRELGLMDRIKQLVEKFQNDLTEDTKKRFSHEDEDYIFEYLTAFIGWPEMYDYGHIRVVESFKIEEVPPPVERMDIGWVVDNPLEAYKVMTEALNGKVRGS